MRGLLMIKVLFQLHSASFGIIQILPIARPIKQKTPISCMKSAFIVAPTGISLKVVL